MQEYDSLQAAGVTAKLYFIHLTLLTQTNAVKLNLLRKNQSRANRFFSLSLLGR
jgi:hypothetical protein